MKYRATPLNIASVLAFGYSIDAYFFPDPEGWATLLWIYMLPWVILGMLLDLIIQKLSKKYLWTFIIESVLVGVIIIIISRLE